jgi:hypothetical protein
LWVIRRIETGSSTLILSPSEAIEGRYAASRGVGLGGQPPIRRSRVCHVDEGSLSRPSDFTAPPCIPLLRAHNRRIGPARPLAFDGQISEIRSLTRLRPEQASKMAEEAQIGNIPAWTAAKTPHRLDRVLMLRADYSLANPDTLTKYKTAAQISHKILEAVTGIRAADRKWHRFLD